VAGALPQLGFHESSLGGNMLTVCCYSNSGPYGWKS
jgi:hypothetical protein